MKKNYILLLILFFYFCTQAYSQTPNKLLNVCKRAGQFSNQTISTSGAGSNYDLVYSRLQLEVDPTKHYVKGSVTSHFKTTENTNQISFDLSGSLSINSITFHGDLVSNFTHQSNVLTINLPLDLNTNQLDSITVDYEGVPSTSEGAFSIGDHNGSPILWTLSEPYGAKDWWVCKQDLNDKIEAIDIFVTAPKGYRSVSNGLLISELESDGKVTAHWQHRYPIAAYLVAIAVTNYKTYSEFVQMPDNTSLEILNYVYPENEASAKKETADLIPMMELFNELFTPYPFTKEKYGHAQFEAGGGMEHQTISFVANFSRGLLAHELAHQWFGDHLTCGTWNEIWLNEGFASYLTGITCEHGLGEQSWKSWINDNMTSVLRSPSGSVYVNNVQSVGRIFDYRLTYQKGALVLHMLRGQIGDEAFFEGVRSYLLDKNLAGKYVRLHNFQSHVETSSGQNLDEFFADWYYGEGYPTYTMNWKQNEETKELTFTLKQESSHKSVEFFEMDVPITFRGTDAQNETITQTFAHTFSGEEYVLPIDFEVEQIIIDPDLWILSKKVVISDNRKRPTEGFDTYPNPTNGYLDIVLPRGKQALGIEIFDTTGKSIKNYSLSAFKNTKIDISDLPKAIYLIRVEFTDNTFSDFEKVIKD